MWHPPADHPIRRTFAGITEHTFLATLGVTDTPLIDYLSDMMARLLSMNDLYRFHDGTGRPLTEVADMVMHAEGLPPEGRTRREVHRHVGDFTLFWTGLFPEAVDRMKADRVKDAFINYCQQGKKSYMIASSFDSDELKDEAQVLRRLSDDYEMWAYGLNQVRLEMDRMQC